MSSDTIRIAAEKLTVRLIFKVARRLAEGQIRLSLPFWDKHQEAFEAPQALSSSLRSCGNA